ncbi:hypothetical protein RB595_008957 [Gaeumannomyces hyphopodioides]
MENPVQDIDAVLRALCQGSADEQQAAIEAYFLPDAAFAHPFCRVPHMQPTRVPGVLFPRREHVVCSRDAVAAIYRWYRFLSPRIEFQIDSRAYDKQNHILYLTIRQRFAIWFFPFYSANVRLVTEVHLSQQPSSNTAAASGPSHEQEAQQGQRAKNDGVGDAAAARPRYLIAKQEDHYQVNEYLRFVFPVLGPLAWTAWQFISSLICVLLTMPLFVLDRASKGKHVLPGA